MYTSIDIHITYVTHTHIYIYIVYIYIYTSYFPKFFQIQGIHISRAIPGPGPFALLQVMGSSMRCASAPPKATSEGSRSW